MSPKSNNNSKLTTTPPSPLQSFLAAQLLTTLLPLLLFATFALSTLALSLLAALAFALFWAGVALLCALAPALLIASAAGALLWLWGAAVFLAARWAYRAGIFGSDSGAGARGGFGRARGENEDEKVSDIGIGREQKDQCAPSNGVQDGEDADRYDANPAADGITAGAIAETENEKDAAIKVETTPLPVPTPPPGSEE